MPVIFSVLMIFSTVTYVILAVLNKMDGIYENIFFTWFEKGICFLFMLGWCLDFYIHPNKKSFLKSSGAILSILVFIPILAVKHPDPFDKWPYASVVVSRVARLYLGGNVIVLKIRANEKWLD